VLLRAHQGELDLVLDIFDMYRARGSGTTPQRGDDLLGEVFDGLVNSHRAGRAGAFHGKEGLGYGDGNPFRVKRRKGAVPADDLEQG
jgi:hypothetical protein